MAFVIVYVISLHTVAKHSDDYHYHTAVNIINCKRTIEAEIIHTLVEVTSSHKATSPAHNEADSIRCRSRTDNFALNSFWIVFAILLRKLSAIHCLNLAH